MVQEHTFQRKRSFWSDEEDTRLVELVEIYGIHNWPEVAGSLQGRDSKSCSLRWRYFLAPHIIRSTDQKLSDWEVAVLVWAQREYGNKWRTIVDNYLPWRSPNDLKNYCNQYVNGKQNHVISQNKLLLQNVPLQTLLAHPPPDVQERWRHVKSVRDSPKGLQPRPGKKGTRGLSYIIRQAVKLKAQRTQPYPSRASSGAPAAETGPSGNTFKRESDGLYGPSGRYPGGSSGSYRPAAPPAAASYSQQPRQGQYSTYGMPYTQQQPQPPQQPQNQQQQPQLAGSNSSGSDSFTSSGIPYGSSPTYPSSSGATMGQQQGCYGYVQGMNMNMNMNMTLNMAGAAAGVQGSAGTCHTAPMPQQQQQQQLPPCWGHPLDSSPAGMSGSEGSAAGQQPCYTPGSASSCFSAPGFNNMGPVNQGVAQPYNPVAQPYNPAAMHGGSCAVAAAPAAAMVLPAPQGAFGGQGTGSFTAASFAGSSFTYASGEQQLQAPVAQQHTTELQQWQGPPDFARGNSCSNHISSSSFGAPMAGTLDCSPSATHTFAPSQAAAVGYTGSCSQHMTVTGLLPPPHSMQCMQMPGHPPQQQQVDIAAYQPMSMHDQHPQLQQQGVDAPARSSGTGAAAAAGQLAGSPPDTIEGVVLLGLDDGDGDFEDIAELLDSDSGGDYCDGVGGCSNAAPAAAAAVAAAAAAAAAMFLGQAPMGLLGPSSDFAVQQEEAHAAAVGAETAGFVQGVIPLREEFSLDIPSDNEGAVDIDFDALLDASEGEACDELDFALSGDDFDLLEQGSGW